ncbi:MAG: class I SAM-dependent methyltransferase [Oscillospiraceae bacterium]|nr:class I SAM-dependent methyltransferase [Oscillospiraceae bacterium]
MNTGYFSKNIEDYRHPGTENYDLIGAMQFNLLTALGLREYHKFLDIGCGSLRAGRLFITYLNCGNYCGIEPEKHLVDDGVNYEIGSCMVHIKEPRFEYSYNFPIASFDEKFDFMVAHSIFTHATQEQIFQCLKNAEQCLKPPTKNNRGGLLAATFHLGDQDFQGKEWVYPGKDKIGFAYYTEDFIHRVAQKSKLAYKKIDWTHPNGQTWVIFGNTNDIEQLTDPTYPIK